MDMPKVAECSVTSCAYNESKKCHTMAITVGEEPSSPICDTFVQSSAKGGSKELMAGVGACKAADCDYNQKLECTAPNINVGMKGQEADCLTFKTRH
jgi:hypothetical protein